MIANRYRYVRRPITPGPSLQAPSLTPDSVCACFTTEVTTKIYPMLNVGWPVYNRLSSCESFPAIVFYYLMCCRPGFFTYPLDLL